VPPRHTSAALNHNIFNCFTAELELPLRGAMKLALVLIAAAVALLAQEAPPAGTSADSERATDLNVNSRYTIESISFTGQRNYQLSTSALEEMRRLIGAKLNTDALNRLAQRVRAELRAHDVTFKLARGGEPESVKVLLQVDQGAGKFDVSIPRFGYYYGQGWTAAGEATATIGPNLFSFRALRDSDSSVEQMAGIQTKYTRQLNGDCLRLALEFDAYRDQYDPATLTALQTDLSTSSSLGAGAYRSRLNFEPSATFVLAKPLTLTVGFSFEQMQPEFSAARSESANALINTLRYHQRWPVSGATAQELDVGYSLRAATKSIASDLSYTRHAVDARYLYNHNRQSVEVKVMAGVIYGQAPLYERFVLGDGTALRGWNKYDLDPLGGNRLAYGSVTYGYRVLRVFYDVGSVWDQGGSPEPEQSAGIGVSSGLGVLQKGAFLLAVAFPLRQGRTDPVLIAGMNF
jgi:outer membrane protein assembly factor BamA